MQYSHSRINLYNTCKYKYKLRYNDNLKVISDNNPDNALLVGLLLHESIELGLEKAEKNYYKKFNLVTNEHINEVIKVKELLPKINHILPKGGQFELPLSNLDFMGFIDYIIETSPDNFDIYDFKYSNHDESYKNSGQLSLYKYYFEKDNPGKKVNNLYYFMIPKLQIKQKKTENIIQFRERIKRETKEPHLIKVEYDPVKVIEHLTNIKHEKETTLFPKNVSNLCSWCEYHDYCIKGEDYMILPKNEKRTIESTKKHVIWIYGAPFTGKTTFANKFPDVLMLNTDGNIKFVDAPYISISNNVTMNGRIKNTKLAWEVFKEVIDELEKKDNDFKSLVVDLLEDLYEHCRLYVYKKLDIQHESDNSFKAWDVVRTEFLSTMKRLLMLDYENIILISHEDTSKDITKRSGDKITSIRPNLSEKVANKIAGMVDIVARVVADGDDRRIEFKQDEVIFGGGRLSNIKDTIIELDYDEMMKVYSLDSKKEPIRKSKKENDEIESTDDVEVEDFKNIFNEENIEKKTTRRRRK